MITSTAVEGLYRRDLGLSFPHPPATVAGLSRRAEAASSDDRAHLVPASCHQPLLPPSYSTGNHGHDRGGTGQNISFLHTETSRGQSQRCSEPSPCRNALEDSILSWRRKAVLISRPLKTELLARIIREIRIGTCQTLCNRVSNTFSVFWNENHVQFYAR